MTKLTASLLETLIKQAGVNYKAVLFYGSDEGLVEECRERITKAVIPNKDPFLKSEFTQSQIKEDPALLSAEVNAISLMGGRKVIVIKGVDNYFTSVFKAFLPTYKGDALIVLTAKSLKTKDSLPTLFATQSDLAVFPCYADEGEGLKRFVFDMLSSNGYQATPDVISFIASNLGADRLQSRSEIEKLFAYMGNEKNISYEDALACIGDASALSTEQFITAMMTGNQAEMHQTLNRLFAEGQSAIGLLRIATAHLKKLHLTLGKISEGTPKESALASLFLHFKQVDSFKRQLNLWDLAKIGRAMDLLSKAEQDCKITGNPQPLICSRVFLQIASQAKRR